MEDCRWSCFYQLFQNITALSASPETDPLHTTGEKQLCTPYSKSIFLCRVPDGLLL